MEGYHGLSQTWMEQITLLSSIIGGFSLAIAVEVLVSGKRERITAILITVFILASSLLLVSTSVGSQIVIKMDILKNVAINDVPVFLRDNMPILGMVVAVIYYLGLSLFMAGLGMAGWLHSKPVGIVTSIIASFIGVTMIVLLYLIR